MLSYIARRLILGLGTMVAISVISFAIIQMAPGDYITTYIAQMASQGSSLSDEAVQNLRIQYGLDQPMYVQYFRWAGLILQGNFGFSMEWKRPVLDVIGDRLVNTVLLSVATLMVTWVLALPVGIYSAVRQYAAGDYVATFIGFIGVAIPNFLLALVLSYLALTVFGIHVGGLFSADMDLAPWSFARLWDLITHLPLPVLVLALAGTAQTMRIMRANLLDELRKPYVVTARAKGLSDFSAIMKYPVRVALNPFASTVGYSLPYIVSGSVIVSLVLSLPTVGPVLLESLVARDMFLAGTIILLLGAMTVIGTFISDLVLLWVDPRIRLTGQAGEK